MLFYTLHYIIKNLKDCQLANKVKELKERLKEILSDKYRPSEDKRDDDYRKLRTKDPLTDYSANQEGGNHFEWEVAHELKELHFTEWEKLIKDFEILKGKDICEENSLDMFDLFFKVDSVFNCFVNDFIKAITKIDYYCSSFFMHRLAYVVRATGNPMECTKSVYEGKISSNGAYLYTIVKIINQLIKSYRKHSVNHECRLVIDKIRNSLESKYLKERYSAFYMVAVHEDSDVHAHLEKRLKRMMASEDEIRNNTHLIKAYIRKVLYLDREERKGSDFSEGKFFAPNIGQCVADAEIHISNQEGSGVTRNYFYSMSEQWMKFSSLILHPGLITPSSEERCMVVAYTAKFNSGCLSRQVGAVITNKSHTIRSIGWNDVPYGQIPCNLRSLKTMAVGDDDLYNIRNIVHSKYELDGSIGNNRSFNEFVRDKYQTLHLNNGEETDSSMKGLPLSYCFKTLQNKYEGEKNQVYTRSLHAEENAILQMAKYGGEPLYQGIIYVTASPCELCCKKLYQIGVRKIVYIDEYPGIARENIICNGFHRPMLKQFQGAYGSTYFKLYQPFISYKDEIEIRRVCNW